MVEIGPRADEARRIATLPMEDRVCEIIELLKASSSRQAVLEEAVRLTPAEIQSWHDRVKWAEGLILQLDEEHNGRNSWLLNYGEGKEAQDLRACMGKPRMLEETFRALATPPAGETE